MGKKINPEYGLRKIIAKAVGIDKPDPRLWGLIFSKPALRSKIVDYLNNERVRFLAIDGLEQCSLVDNKIVSDLRERRLKNLAYNLYLSKAYDDISRTFETAGIAHTPIKGLDLIRGFYDDPSLRPISDIDILVAPADFDGAIEKLLVMGYKPMVKEHRLPGVWPSANFVNPSSGRVVMVDLHYCLGPVVKGRLSAVGRLFLDCAGMDGLSTEYRILVLVTHFQNHFMVMPLIAYYELLNLARRANSGLLNDLLLRWNAHDAAASALSQAIWLFGGVSLPAENNLKSCLLGLLTAPDLYRYRAASNVRDSISFILSLDNPGSAGEFGIKLVLDKIRKTG